MGKKKNALVGRIFHLFKDDWPQYSDVCPDIGYWTGKFLDYCPKKDPANPYKCLIVEDGEDSEFWYFSFEWIKARLVLLEGEIREDIRQDNRKRRSSGPNLSLHSIAGGSRAVHTTSQKRRAEDKSKWGRINKRVAQGFNFRAAIRPAEELCGARCSKDCKKVTEAMRNKAQAEFVLPPDSTTLGEFEVCWQFFRNTFGLGKHGKIVRNLLQESHNHVFPNTNPTNRGAEIAKARGLLTTQKIKEHLKSFPREASHYANNMNHGNARYFLAPDLFPAKLWQLFCHMHLPEFAQQAEKLGWWRSLDSDRKKPPSVTALEESEEEKKVYAEWDEHRQQADTSYDSRNVDAKQTDEYYPLPLAKDEKPAYNSLKKVETQSQDFGGNLRTPRLSVGEAFYLRILATFVYCIFSQARRCAVLYFWNEKIAEKGANNCVSIAHYQHTHFPSGAMHLIKWYDGTASQCNNGTMLHYNVEITDPDIPEMYMYQRMDVKIPPIGHTYLINDTWFGAISRAAKKWSIISDMADWIAISAGCRGKTPPICVEPAQEVHRNWAEYLSQRQVKTTRTDSNYNKVNISEFHWFNFGVGEAFGPDGKPVLMPDGKPQLESHPGEVWMRKDLKDKQPWVILDLRRNAPK
eukprot:gene8907-10553_t